MLACSTGRRTQNEPSVAVHPAKPDVVVAGSNDYCAEMTNGVGNVWAGYYRSANGGQTWSNSLVPGYPTDASAAGRASPTQGVCASVLDAMAATALDRHDQAEAGRLVDALMSLAARGDMRELVVRAHLHRSRLGDPTALASARLLAAGIDNPALVPLLDDHHDRGRLEAQASLDRLAHQLRTRGSSTE